jgi:hypothetical protein
MKRAPLSLGLSPLAGKPLPGGATFVANLLLDIGASNSMLAFSRNDVDNCFL